MRTIKIPFPDISFYEKTRLAGKDARQITINKGQSELIFRNPAGFSANDYFVIEAFEGEDAEICQIHQLDKESHVIDLEDQIYQDHDVGVIMTRTPFNKVKVFKGSVMDDMTTHTEIAGSPFDLRPDNAYTFIVDPDGVSADYYSYRYLNSYLFSIGAGTPVVYPSGTYGTQTPYGESDYESMLTVRQLKEWFMFGLDLTDDDGYPFPNTMLEFAIRAAVDSLEKTLNIMLKPTIILQEFQDFHAQDYRDFAFLQLSHWPVLSVEQIAVWYPTAQAPVIFPLEWVQLRAEHGQIHLVPTSGSLSTILLGKGGDYLTFVWRGFDFMPNLWRIDYTAGMTTRDTYVNSAGVIKASPAGSKIPADILGVIGKMACFYPLNIAGDLVGGIAIASKSIGVDGLSQSINTTSSPENAGYSARLRQYERELKIEIPRLKAFYAGLQMAVM
jgi:hypothetical protein